MRSLPQGSEPSADAQGLALYKPADDYDVMTYAENDNNKVSAIDDNVETLYVDHGYFFSRTPTIPLYFSLLK